MLTLMQMNPPASREELDEEVIANLRSLGYDKEDELVDAIMSDECV